MPGPMTMFELGHSAMSAQLVRMKYGYFERSRWVRSSAAAVEEI